MTIMRSMRTAVNEKLGAAQHANECTGDAIGPFIDQANGSDSYPGSAASAPGLHPEFSLRRSRPFVHCYNSNEARRSNPIQLNGEAMPSVMCLVAGTISILSLVQPQVGAQTADRNQAVNPELVRTGRVELLARKAHGSYERSCFSFSAGARGEKCRDELGNNFDLQFGNGGDRFSVRMVTDDESLIQDIGAKTFEQIDELPELTPADSKAVEAVEGHAYLVRTKDRTHQSRALFRVVALHPNDRCTIDWIMIPDNAPPPNGLELGAEIRARLGGLLARQKFPEKPVPVLASPRVRLQLRAGAGGGNPNRIDMTGETSIYVRTRAVAPLSFEKPVSMKDDATAFFEGGVIPAGKRFIVTRAKYRGTCVGDSNGHGELILRIGDIEIVNEQDNKQPIQGEWTGRTEILPGDEHRVFAEVANSSTLDVEISGEIVAIEGGK